MLLRVGTAVLAAGVLAILAFFATGAAGSPASDVAQQDQSGATDGPAEESGSLEFVVTSVIGRALNVPGTY